MQQSIKHIRNVLIGIYPDSEISSISRLLISKITGYSFTEIIINKNTIFSQHQRTFLEFYLEKLKNSMPIQYVLGETEFCGLDFVVDETVLIPRPETEELVEWIVKETITPCVVLDIGTGCGCIAISLKSLLPEAIVYACDISKEALKVAHLNALNNRQEVNFFELDILNAESAIRNYDVIVSNPPYIPKSEIESILPHVKDFEPHLALFVDEEDPLIFYRKIAVYAQQQLFPGGNIYFEVHRDYANTCRLMLEEMDFINVVLKKDIYGNHRMLRAEKDRKG